MQFISVNTTHIKIVSTVAILFLAVLLLKEYCKIQQNVARLEIQVLNIAIV